MKNTKETQILQKVTLKEISAIFQINLSIPVLPSGTLLQYSVPVLCSGLRVIKDAVATLPVTREQGTSGSKHRCSGSKRSGYVQNTGVQDTSIQDISIQDISIQNISVQDTSVQAAGIQAANVSILWFILR